MPAVGCLDDGDTGLVGYSHQLQIRDGGYLLGCDSHGTGLRRIEDIVEPPEKGRILLNDLVGVDAGEFFFQIIAVQPVEVIESGESPPAQMQCTVDVFLSPGHNGAEFIPVGDILEFHIVQGRAGDDHAVVFPVFYLIEGSVEGFQMIGIGMLRHIAGGLQELHIDLDSLRRSWVSVTILVGIRFRISTSSGRISWCMARYSVMTKIFSFSSVVVAGKESATLMGMVSFLTFHKFGISAGRPAAGGRAP